MELVYPNVQLLTKKCVKCEEIKPLYAFNYIHKSKSKLESWCKACTHKSTAQWTKRRSYGPPISPKSRSVDKAKYRITFRGFMSITYTSCKRRSRVKNAAFSLTIQYLIDLWNKQDGKCALSGLDLQIEAKPPPDKNIHPMKASLDRIESTLGYTEGNVRWVCWFANAMKLESSDEEFKNNVSTVYHYLNKP